MRVTDVIAEAYGPPGSKSLGIGNFQTLMNHLQGRKTSRDLRLELGDDNVIEIDDDDLDFLIDYYNKLANTDMKKDFVYGVMSRSSRLVALLDKLGVKYTINRGTQPGLLEDKKKEADTELSRDTVKDPKLAVALRKAYAKQPSARSDLEALIRQDIEQQADTQDSLERQSSMNQRQERNLQTLRDLARKQSQLLRNLDAENTDQDREITDLEQEIKNLADRGADRGEQSRYTTRHLGTPDADLNQAPDRETEPSIGAEPEVEPVKQKTKTKIAKAQRTTKPTEPTTGGAPAAPVRPQGPRPSGGAGGLALPFTPSTTVAPAVTPTAPAPRPNTIDILDKVPDRTDIAVVEPTNTVQPEPFTLGIDQPDTSMPPMAANDDDVEPVPTELQRRRAAESSDLSRLRSLAGLK